MSHVRVQTASGDLAADPDAREAALEAAAGLQPFKRLRGPPPLRDLFPRRGSSISHEKPEEKRKKKNALTTQLQVGITISFKQHYRKYNEFVEYLKLLSA